ncbi:hypothetical protein GGR52DRAFT_586762 [Hypoxylon sp. FL1284]|nr:hypothetical protein GGR52DRAFT_586762 [Hypoxylon sp. FL1284]
MGSHIPNYRMIREEKDLEKRSMQIWEEHSASRPHENIRARWAEQGIWNENWNSRAHGIWKHEEPLPKPAPQYPLKSKNSAFLTKTQRRRKDKFRKPIKPQPREPLERQASRPLHQFFYQVTLASEQIQHELRMKGVSNYAPGNINSRAYRRVKETWVRRGIWDAKWIILPGKVWKHERPIQDLIDEDRIAYKKEKALAEQGNRPELPNSLQIAERMNVGNDSPEDDVLRPIDSPRTLKKNWLKQCKLFGGLDSGGDGGSFVIGHNSGCNTPVEPPTITEPPADAKPSESRNRRRRGGLRLENSSKPKGIVKERKITKRDTDLKRKLEKGL